jgi:hypothetical protein
LDAWKRHTLRLLEGNSNPDQQRVRISKEKETLRKIPKPAILARKW